MSKCLHLEGTIIGLVMLLLVTYLFLNVHFVLLLYSYLLSNNTEQHGVLNSSPQHALQSNSNCGWETLNQEVCVGKDANLDLKIDSVFLSFR